MTGLRGSRIFLRMDPVMRRIFIVLCAACAVLASPTARSATIPSPDDLKQSVPGSAGYERRPGAIDYYEMQDGHGRAVGLAFVTSSIPPQVMGYSGELDVLVGMDWDGKITGAKIIGHRETADYVQRIVESGLLRKFLGRTAGDEFSDIEAVTGATISSRAIIDDVRSAAKAVHDYVRSGRTPGASLGVMRQTDWLGGLGALLVVALAGLCAAMPSRRRLRWLAMAASVAIVGLWLNAPITIGGIVDLRSFGLALRHNLPLVILMAFAFAAALLRGNLYCAYVCPFGALQEGAAWLSRRKVRPGRRLERNMRWLRWIVAILAIYAIAVAGDDAFRSIEPFATLFMRYPGAVTLVQAGVVLMAALLVRRIWCRFLCPTGLVVDLVAELGGKIRHAAKSLRRRAHG
ncbi:MAG: 4Fe-4S binding protein [Proteobacteria bacterium]|nr:4Fe-4S binding protein [Pseudomonadota bacterium]